MASVHIDEVRRWAVRTGQRDALPSDEGMFFEIRFESSEFTPATVDAEFADEVLTVDSPQGIVTISFDSFGWLKSIDIS